MNTEPIGREPKESPPLIPESQAKISSITVKMQGGEVRRFKTLRELMAEMKDQQANRD